MHYRKAQTAARHVSAWSRQVAVSADTTKPTSKYFLVQHTAFNLIPCRNRGSIFVRYISHPRYDEFSSNTSDCEGMVGFNRYDYSICCHDSVTFVVTKIPTCQRTTVWVSKIEVTLSGEGTPTGAVSYARQIFASTRWCDFCYC